VPTEQLPDIFSLERGYFLTLFIGRGIEISEGRGITVLCGSSAGELLYKVV
jgi:hypothetical protein